MTVRPSPPFRDFEIAALLREVAEPGTGKTQFRRVLKPQPYVARHCTVCGLGMGEWSACEEPDCGDLGPGLPIVKTLPFAIGDLLWCRETFAIVPASAYRCSDGIQQIVNPHDPYDAAIYRENFDRSGRPGWRSSTQMPRWASRLTLEVVGVKIERVQEISEDDAVAEGVERAYGGVAFVRLANAQTYSTVRGCFGTLWSSVHGQSSLDANPFVHAVTFHPHLANVDDLLRQREGER